MATQAEFGIKTTSDVQAIDALIEKLSRLTEYGPKVAESFKAAAVTMSESMVSADGKIVASRTATAEKIKNAVLSETQIAEQANQIKARSDAEYANLKHEYVLKGLDATRQAIHEEEQLVKSTRDAIAKATREGADKETQAVLKGERDKQNARLQGLRSVEKEITGARTFTEQLEKNVYEPIQKGTAKAEATAKEYAAKAESFAKESAAKIETIEKQGAERVAVAVGEIEKKKVAQEIEEEVRLTKAQQVQEGIRLQQHKAEADKEVAESKSAKGKESGGGAGIGGILAGGGILMGMKEVVAATEAASAAQSRLQAATGLTGESLLKAKEDAEELGHQYKIGGEAGQDAMAAVGSFTHATGDELKRQTADAIILSQKMNVSVESAAKMLGKAGDPEIAGNLKKLGINLDANASAEERAAAVHVAAMNAKAGVDAANDTAMKNSQETMNELKETAGKYASEMLSLANGPLKILLPILPELALAIVAITIAMNAQSIAAKANAIWDGIQTVGKVVLTIATGIGTIAAAAWAIAVNAGIWPVLAVVAAIGLLVLGIVELVKHWKEVIEWVGKAVDSVLSFLGIQGEADAATSKHTKALKDNKKSLEDVKKANEDAAKASGEYTDALKKNNQEVEASSKDMQDNAIAAIQDINAKLADSSKRLKGDTEESLKATLAQWKDYGKRGVAQQEQSEKEKHDAALSIGAAADKEDTTGAKKAAKSKEDIAKESADSILNSKKESIAAERSSDAKKHVEEIQAEIVHTSELLAIAQKFHGEKSAQAKSEQNKLTTLRNTLQKDERVEMLNELKSASEDAQSMLEQRGLKEHLTDRQIAKEKFEIERKALADEIALRKSWGEDVSKLQMQLGTLELKNADEIQKEKLAKQIENDAVEHDIQKQKLDARKDSIQKELDLVDFQYREELAKLHEQLEAKKLTTAQYDQLADVARQKDLQQQKEIHKKERDAQLATLDQISSASAVYGQAQQAINQTFFAPILDNWKNQKTFAMQALATITEGLLGYVEQWLAQKAAMLATSLVDSLLATATTTAAAAESAAVWAPAAISASIATLGAADAAGAAAFGTAQAAGQVVGHLAAGTDDWRGGLTFVGERGPEIMNVPRGAQVIPNHHLPNLGQPPVDLTPLISRLDSIHRATVQGNQLFAQRPAPILPVNSSTLGVFNNASKAENRREW